MTGPAWVGRAITPSNTDLDYLTQAATLAQAAANKAMTGGGVGHTLTLAGGLSGVSFNGSADVTAAVISAPVLSPGATINGVLFTGGAPITITASVAHALTAGTHLAGGPYDGSAAVTLTTDATSANTASTIVARDGSGNFTAGTITAALTGNVTGNVSGSAATVTAASQPAITTAANLTTIGTLVAGQVNAQFVTSGTFGSASGDTNPYLFSNGIVLGAAHTPTPTMVTAQSNNITAYGDAATLLTVMRLYNAASPGTLALGRYDGTPAAPTAVVSGDQIATLNFQGYDGTTATMVTGAHIIANATQNWSNAPARGSKIVFQTVPNGSGTLTTALTLDQDQSATFAGAVTGGAASFTTGTFSGNVAITESGGNAQLLLNPTAGGGGDSAQVVFQRNSVTKWQVGNNTVAGSDAWQVSNNAGTVAVSFNQSTAALTTQALNTLGDFSVATSKFTVASASGNTVVAGTLGITGLTSAAALTASGLITASAGLTVASGQTLTLTGATVAGTPTWSSSQAITLSTAAQPNVTSVGTLTALTVTGLLTLGNILLADGQTINWGGVGTGTWISASTAGHDIQMLVNSAPVLTLTTSLVQCGQPLRLANAYVSGVIVATGHVTIQDSTGTTYQVLCHT